MTDSDTGRDADDASKNGNGAKTILAQARKDWDAAELRERHNIRLAYEDLEFLAGDELSQWPEKQRRERENDGRPTLQINQLPQVVHQIRRHPPASPVDQGHSGRQRRRRADRGPARRPDPLHRTAPTRAPSTFAPPTARSPAASGTGESRPNTPTARPSTRRSASRRSRTALPCCGTLTPSCRRARNRSCSTTRRHSNRIRSDCRRHFSGHYCCCPNDRYQVEHGIHQGLHRAELGCRNKPG
jgi:hypothetical protein